MGDIAVVDAVGNKKVCIIESPYAADASKADILIVGGAADVGYRATILAVDDADELRNAIGSVHNSNDAASSTSAIFYCCGCNSSGVDAIVNS